ncbi:MAG: hypothetical protein ABSC53_03610 [Bacteroidota bacterium]
MNYRRGNTLRVLQLWGSACFQQLENYQRRIPQQKHLRINLLVRRLSWWSRHPLGGYYTDTN